MKIGTNWDNLNQVRVASVIYMWSHSYILKLQPVLKSIKLFQDNLLHLTWARTMGIQPNVLSRMSVKDGDSYHSTLNTFLTIQSFSE